MACVFIGAGSNIKPDKYLTEALKLLRAKVSLTGVSTFYWTEPINHKQEPLFCNGVFRIGTTLDPKTLKYTVLRKIETSLGRIRGEDKHAPRTIDLDILLYDNKVIREKDIIIPDPDITKRNFIAIPLFELAPDLILPDTGKSLKDVVFNMKIPKLKTASAITDQLKKGQ